MHQNAYWRNGPAENNAIAGVDLALWDIKGKLANMPVFDLIGGKVREGVPVYRHVEGNTVDDICEQIVEFQEIGLKHLRVQMGGYGGGKYGSAPGNAAHGAPDGVYLNSRKYIEETINLFSKIREKLGPDIQLIHDVHERITLPETIRLAKELEPFDLFYLEDAIALEDIENFRVLRNASTIPLAVGELFNNPAEWRMLISEHLIDYIRVHITQIGGFTPARKLQVFAEQHGVSTAWHGPGDMSPVAHAANIHLDLASSNFGIQEWSGINPPNFVIQDLSGPEGALLDAFDGLPEYRDGYVYPNSKPGFGIELNEKVAKKYPAKLDVTTWTQTRRFDGSLVKP